jgi:hypothetical protein
MTAADTRGESRLPLLAIIYVNQQLGNLVRYWHAQTMLVERQAVTAFARMNGRPANHLRFRGPNPAKLAQKAADRFATLRAAFERVAVEEGAEADVLVGESPQGSVILAMADSLTEKAGDLHPPSVSAQADIVRGFLAELRGLGAKKETAAVGGGERVGNGGERAPHERE